jgi:hypothetical protein
MFPAKLGEKRKAFHLYAGMVVTVEKVSKKHSCWVRALNFSMQVGQKNAGVFVFVCLFFHGQHEHKVYYPN